MENKWKQMWEELEESLDKLGLGMPYIMKSVKAKYFPPLLKTKLTLKLQSYSERDMDYVRQTMRILEEYLRDRKMSFDIEWQSDEELRGDPFFY